MNNLNPIATAVVLAISSGLLLPPTALAQDSQDTEVILVKGIRGSLISSVEAKRESPTIVDAITSEDVGKFPSENVAEAVQRITGVQITRTRGEGTGASIRGMPVNFTRVQLNGNTLANAAVDLRGGGAGGTINRNFDFRLLPSEFVRTLEVEKSPSASSKEGGLSGTITVKTARPLELGSKFAFSAYEALDSNSGKWSPRVSGLYSDTFAGDRLGVLLAAAYTHSQPETHAVNNTGWGRTAESILNYDYNNDADLDDSLYIPSQIRTEVTREDRKRTALAGAIEYELNDTTKLYTEGFYSKRELESRSLENIHLFANGPTGVFDTNNAMLQEIDGIDPSLPAYGVPFALQLNFSNVDVRGNDRINDSVAKTQFLKAGVEYDNGTWEGEVSVAYSNSEQLGDNLNLAQIQRFNVGYTCLSGQDVCGLNLTDETAARYLDPAQGIVASLNGAFDRRTEDEVLDVQFDIARYIDNSPITKLSFGGVATQHDIYANAQFLVVPAANLAPIAGLQPSQVQPSGYSIEPYAQVVSAGSGAFLGTYNGNMNFPSQYLATDTRKLLNTVSRSDLINAGFIINSANDVVDQGEDILAFYGQADFASNDDAISGNFGVRWVKTDSNAVGVSPDLAQIEVLRDQGGIITVPPAGPISVDYSYSELLPSANIKFRLSDELELRFAASRTLARPEFADVSPSTTLAGTAGNYQMTTGNPTLSPYIAINFDTTLEWYKDMDTTVTIALFHKDLATLVRPTNDIIYLPVTSIYSSTDTRELSSEEFTRTRPDNQDGVTLKGFEFGYQQFFTEMPGFLSNTGVQANYTYISNSDPQVLTAASKHNFNLGLFYETDSVGARISYTWRDEFVSAGLPNAYNGLGTTIGARGTLDANLSYMITERLSVSFEGTNLTDEVDTAKTILGNLPVDYFDTGRRLMVGVRYSY